MRNEIAFYSKENAMKVAEVLVDNGYIVMLSTEEDLIILNYLDGEYMSHLGRTISDRNAVVFMSREDFDSDYVSVESLNEDDDDDGI